MVTPAIIEYFAKRSRVLPIIPLLLAAARPVNRLLQVAVHAYCYYAYLYRAAAKVGQRAWITGVCRLVFSLLPLRQLPSLGRMMSQTMQHRRTIVA